MSDVKNTLDLRKMLLDTIDQVKAGTLNTQTARTVAALSTTILQSAKLDLEYLRFNAAQEKSIEPASHVLALIDEKTGTEG